MAALEENSLLDFVPKTPTLFCHGANDLEVPIENSRAAYQKASAAGAPVKLTEVPNADHGGAAPRCYETAVTWFESLR
jgi:dipeptidyl aminopeptidase/acylaminoacyl peptidase